MKEKQKVYVIVNSWQYDSGEVDTSVNVYGNEKAARNAFKDLVKDARCDYGDIGENTIQELDEERLSFSIYEDGYYSANHIDITTSVQEVVDEYETTDRPNEAQTVYVLEGTGDGVGVSVCDLLDDDNDDGKVWGYDSFKRRFYGKTNEEFEEFSANNTCEGDRVETQEEAIEECRKYWVGREAEEKVVHQYGKFDFESLDIRYGDRVIVYVHYDN